MQIAIRLAMPSNRIKFERLMDLHRPSIIGIALRLTRSQDEAEDLAQDATVRAWNAFDSFDGANFKAWVLRIVTNLYINRHRTASRRPSFESIEGEPAIDPPDRDAYRPDERLLATDLGHDVRAALADVPKDFRAAVVLCDLEGLSYQEIADRLGCPVGTVRSRLFRGRTIMRASLRIYAESEGYIPPIVPIDDKSQAL